MITIAIITTIIISAIIVDDTALNISYRSFPSLHVVLIPRRDPQVRPLYTEVGIFPNTHGSALFSRGNTQVVFDIY